MAVTVSNLQLEVEVFGHCLAETPLPWDQLGRVSVSAFHPCPGVGDSKGDAVAAWLVLAGPLHGSCSHPGASRRCHQAETKCTGKEMPPHFCAPWLCRWPGKHGCSSAASAQSPPTMLESELQGATTPFRPHPPFHLFHPKASQLLHLSTGCLQPPNLPGAGCPAWHPSIERVARGALVFAHGVGRCGAASTQRGMGVV